MEQLLETINAATIVVRLIEIVSRLHKLLAVAAFGVKKVEGVRIQKNRRATNDAAVSLLNPLSPGFDGNKLTEGHRRTLQRRLQEWRVRVVRELLYGTRADGFILTEPRK